MFACKVTLLAAPTLPVLSPQRSLRTLSNLSASPSHPRSLPRIQVRVSLSSPEYISCTPHIRTRRMDHQYPCGCRALEDTGAPLPPPVAPPQEEIDCTPCFENPVGEMPPSMYRPQWINFVNMFVYLEFIRLCDHCKAALVWHVSYRADNAGGRWAYVSYPDRREQKASHVHSASAAKNLTWSVSV